MKKLSFAFAVLLLTSAIASCGATETETTEITTNAETSVSTAEPEDTYAYRDDWSGEAMRILNYEDPFEMNSKLTTDGTTGEVLNDTKYSRMLTLKDKMGVSIEETNVAHDQYMSFARSVLASAEDTYDFLYINDQDQNALAKEGYLMNLFELDALQLSEDWWLHERNALVTVGDTLYCAQGYANLLVVDTLNIMLFNEDLAKSIDIEVPYSLVMDGNWTLEKFNEYLKLGANLNRGADVPDTENIWNYDQPGNGAACSGLLVGCGENIFDIQDGQVVLSAGSERFYNACNMIADIMSRNQPYMFYKEQFGVSTKFRTGQALFSYGEIVTTQQLRTQDFAFGVLPSPKFDETQERYYCRQSWPSAGVAIPTAVTDPEKSAVFADALNYISYNVVWPIYRGLVLEQKNLRNEESIEMLDIILRSGTPALNMIYSIGDNMIDQIGERLLKGNMDVASLIASKEAKIEKQLKKLNDRE